MRCRLTDRSIHYQAPTWGLQSSSNSFAEEEDQYGPCQKAGNPNLRLVGYNHCSLIAFINPKSINDDDGHRVGDGKGEPDLGQVLYIAAGNSVAGILGE